MLMSSENNCSKRKPLSCLIFLLITCILLMCMTACGNTKDAEKSSETKEQNSGNTAEDNGMRDMKKLSMEINGTEVSVAWEDNESTAALEELAGKAPITVQMSMYGGFEQVGSLGASLPRNDSQTTTSAGDIVLYSGNQIVVFYGSNSWAYTRLGRITDKTAAELAELLGNGDVTITIEMN